MHIESPMASPSPQLIRDALQSSPTATTALIASLLILIALSWTITRRSNSTNRKLLPPQPSGSWPLIGHLHLLSGPEVPHKTLAKMADEYGPIFQIKLGVHPTVVVSNWEMAKECLSTHDRAFSSRPRTRSFELLGYGCAMIGVTPYGPYWREVRKISTIELLSNNRIAMLKHVWMSEVRASVKDLYNQWSARVQEATTASSSSGLLLVDMKQWFADIALNSILRIVVGISLRDVSVKEERERCYKSIRTFFDLTGIVTPSDAIPFLKWLDIDGHERTMRTAAKEIDFFAQKWLDDHRRDRVSGGGTKEKRDFMDVMVEIFDDEQQQKTVFEYDTDTIIKATCQAIILAGADTTSITLTWALSLLLNNPTILKKAQAQIDSHVSRERLVEETDLHQFVYLQAIIKETLRLYPAGPLSVPRESIEDVVLSGYYIPAGTRLFVNLHKIHRDPHVWGDRADEFFPERFFLGTHKDWDVRGQNFEIIPFGAGRRICPGISFALQSLSFTLANLLHGFALSSPSGKPIDMNEGAGMTSSKISPLDVLLTPRLPRELYQNIV